MSLWDTPANPNHPIFRAIRDIQLSEEEVREVLQKIEEDWKPTADGRCKSKDCNGLVVQKCGGCVGMVPYYRPAECAACGRTYPRANRETTPQVGVQQMLRRLRETVYD